MSRKSKERRLKKEARRAATINSFHPVPRMRFYPLIDRSPHLLHPKATDEDPLLTAQAVDA